MDYAVELTLYIVVSVLLFLIFFLLFFFKPIRAYFRNKFTIRTYYRTVRKSALENDFYLINQFVLLEDETKSGVHIDHILFGDKFIYIIKDKYFKGALAAKEEDQSWVWFKTKNSKEYIDNPMTINCIRCDRLSMASGLDRAFFISVVLVNDDVFITPIKSKDNSSVILPLSKFTKYIEMNEKRSDVEKFSEEDLAIAVRDLAELNRRGK